MSINILVALLLSYTIAVVFCDSHGGGGDDDRHMKQAICTVSAKTGMLSYPVEGTVTFKQWGDSDISIHVSLSGFNTTDNHEYHGFHVHQYGNMGKGCKDAGGHFNPHDLKHGGPQMVIRHVGDLGNLYENGSSTIDITFTDSYIKFEGDNNIIGKAIVIHADKDDFGLGNNTGSWKTGNAGPRLGCCIIKEVNGPTDSASMLKINSFILLIVLSLFRALL